MPSTYGHRLAAALAALACAMAAPARADERPIIDALSISNEDECLTSAVLATVVASWLGRATIDERLRVVVDRGEVDTSVIVLRDAQMVGARRFAQLPTECADRRAVVALAIALGIDAALLDRVSRAEPPEEPIEPPADPTEPVADAVRTASPRLALEMSLDGTALLAIVGDLAWAGGASVALRVDDVVRVSVGMLGTSLVGEPLGSAHFDAFLIAGRLDACLLHTFGVLEVDGCLGVAAGAFDVQGRGYASDRHAQLGWAAASARFEASAWIDGALALVLALDGFLPFVRPRPEIVGPSGEVTGVFDPSAVGLGISIGLRARFR